MNHYFNEEKTEDATPNKIKKFQESGQVQHLYDLNSFFILLFFFLLLYVNQKNIFLFFINLFISSFTFNFHVIYKNQRCLELLLKFIKNFILYFFVLFLGIFFILFFSPIFIYGKINKIHFLKIRLNSFNIIGSFLSKSIINAIVESFFFLIKVLLIVFVSFFFVWSNYLNLNQFFYFSFFRSICMGFQYNMKHVFLLITVVLLIAIINTSFQYFQYFNNLKMTVQEVKDEQKELEGNPFIKQRIKSLVQISYRESISSELMKSDLIIFNGKNCAIAIQYDMNIMHAPKILLKGQNHLALKIITISKKNNIPIFISDSLAAYLYRDCSAGDYIPHDLYKILVKILSWASRFKLWKKYGGICPPMPVIIV